MHYYNFNISSYLSHTNHLDDLEDLAYRRMLDYCYLHESPLPKNIKEIAKLIRMRTECERIADVLQEFFISEEDGFYHVKVNAEINKYRTRSESAKKAANARWDKNTLKNKVLSSDANAMRTHSECNAKQELRTKKQEPRNKNYKKPLSQKYCDDDLKAANYIYDLILKIKDDFKKPNLETWANEVRKMIEIDKRTHKEICELFKWANQDDFWQSNILSPAKLRKQFDQLAIKKSGSKLVAQDFSDVDYGEMEGSL